MRKRGALLTLLLAVTALTCLAHERFALAADPITRFGVQDLSRPGPTPVAGWYFHPIDLNTGVGGDYIYAGWHRGSGRAVTHVRFRTFSDGQNTNPFGPEWEWSPVDLNRRAGGKYIYMFWKRSPGSAPVYNMTFMVTSANSPPPLSGYQAIAVDLNAGAGGPYIWPYVTYDSSNADERSKSLELRGDGEMLTEATQDMGGESKPPASQEQGARGGRHYREHDDD